ncbi:unnamed protein product [Calypogeia fissa]
MYAISRSSSSKVHSNPAAGYSHLNSMSLNSHSSLNAALQNASSAAESLQYEEEEEDGASEFQGAEEGEEQQQPSNVNRNGWKRGKDGRTVNGSTRQHIHEGIEGIEGLSTQLSTMGSVPMEDLSEGDEVVSSSDYEPFEASELQLIEDALRSLRSVEEGNIEASKAVEPNFSSSNDLQDVARLLKKVQAVKERNKGAPLKNEGPDRSLGQGPPGMDVLDSADIRQVVQAAAQTALAAARTAETVVSSLNRNSEAMEKLCKVLTGSNSLQAPNAGAGEEQVIDEEEGKILEIELQQTEIAKSLIRQNRLTHWVLGFIVVSSLVWRYGVVKFVKKVNNTIQNPFQGITDMFKPKPPSEEEDNGLQFKLPPILTPEAGEAREDKRHAEKEREEKRFDLGRMFQGQEDKEDEKMFNLGKIGSNLPGHDHPDRK